MNPITHITHALAAACTLALVSCTSGGLSPSGFLRNYTQLDSGHGTADAAAAFVKPGVDFNKYDSVMIDPVATIVASPAVAPAVKEQLAAYLAEAFRTQALANMTVVASPGPSTLRLRAALTDVIGGQQTGRPITTVHTNPQTTLTGRLGSQEIASFISNVRFESEILDSTGGERLTALIDHRIGVKREAKPETTWAAVRSANQQGAARLWRLFREARGH
jgi:hypothetical protein